MLSSKSPSASGNSLIIDNFVFKTTLTAVTATNLDKHNAEGSYIQFFSKEYINFIQSYNKNSLLNLCT